MLAEFANGTLVRDAQRVCLQILKVSEESLGRDETPRQTGHEHFTSI